MVEHAWVVPKALKQVRMWIHPEGQVLAGIYLVSDHPGELPAELPIDLLNQPAPFLACQCHGGELRFYNKNALVRMEYESEDESLRAADVVLRGEFGLMDGSVFVGAIRENLPPERRRLLDYLNVNVERFIRVFLEEEARVALINKAYIVRAIPRD
ncbi:hypothetical protein [Acidihalobacter prosperus]|uniref:Uncharacterized protein n=1 Tax=Acidihalobacter prosperus TaxID=160660 RepID=A0A1A6C4Z7_9GAMM|nr:hypothetical protein [Acidihalobacter prosperus]OBS09633.1 hypothetical protein Thpro_021961 [Acidihalobacter prosperus]